MTILARFRLNDLEAALVGCVGSVLLAALLVFAAIVLAIRLI
jgi:hypothetical protein